VLVKEGADLDDCMRDLGVILEQLKVKRESVTGRWE